jgi:hypothetical protein
MKEIPEENRKAVLEKTRDLFGPWVEEESIRRTIPSLFPIYTDDVGTYSMEELIDFCRFAASKGFEGHLRIIKEDPEDYEELEFDSDEIRKTRFRIVYEPEYVEKIPVEVPPRPRRVSAPGM